MPLAHDLWLQTIIFSFMLVVGLALSFHKDHKVKILPPSLTTELKGLAILTVIFAHIGIFIFHEQFLWPLSSISGVGVNLFLFLSGYGLTTSAHKQHLGVLPFYRKRLSKLYLPYWIALLCLLLVNLLFLHETQSPAFIIQAALGYITNADIYHSFNSVLWYFTFIAGYYLLFPLVYIRRHAWVTALILLAIGQLVVAIKLPLLGGVQYLYSVHTLAFPLGVLLAYAVTQPKVTSLLLSIQGAEQEYAKRHMDWTLLVLRYGVLALAIAYAGYSALHIAILTVPLAEQCASISTMLAVLLIFILKPVRFTLFSLFGVYSYEIYLLHWPIVYKYNQLFAMFPPWLATGLYLALFLLLGYGIHTLTQQITRHAAGVKILSRKNESASEA